MKQYATYLSRWVTYCKNKQLDVTHATINNSLDFVTLQRWGRLQCYHTARSALSSAITPAGKTTFGEHPLVTRFLKGTFELRPSLPRYSTIWDVGIVPTHLRSFPALNDLTLKQLTLNLTMLLALVTTKRTQTLSKTGHLMYAGNHDWNYLHYTGDPENNSTWQTPYAH